MHFFSPFLFILCRCSSICILFSGDADFWGQVEREIRDSGGPCRGEGLYGRWERKTRGGYPAAQKITPCFSLATATTSSEDTIRTPGATIRSRGSSTDDHDSAVGRMELEFQQPGVPPEVTPPPEEILPEERRNPRGPEEIIPNQAQITHRNREGTPEVTPPPEEILPGNMWSRHIPRGPEEIIPDQAQITHRNQEEEEKKRMTSSWLVDLKIGRSMLNRLVWTVV
jgi:hypothetical protein